MTLNDEKDKITHSHKLEIRRIWLDKFLFAVLIAIAVFIGNLVFEGYKSDLAKTQFLLEKRLEALMDLRVSFSNLGQRAFAEAYKIGPAQPDDYAQEVYAFMHIINRWGHLFSDDFNQKLNHYAWIHQAVAGTEIQLNRKQWGFMIDLGQAFDSDTRTALNVEVLGTPPRTQAKHFRI